MYLTLAVNCGLEEKSIYFALILLILLLLPPSSSQAPSLLSEIGRMEDEIFGMNIDCLIESLEDSTFPDYDCLFPIISKLLGYVVIFASLTLKLPQIYQIVKSGSVRGLSVVSFELETFGYTIALAYCIYKDLPFFSYGEYVFLVIQCDILVAIIYYYSQPLEALTLIKAMLYSAITPLLLIGDINPVLFEALYASQHAIFFFARLPQIWENFANKSTGELNLLSSLMTVTRSMIRLFTNIQEGSPPSMVFGNVMGIVMNGALLLQIFIYPKPSSQEQQLKQLQQKKKNKNKKKKNKRKKKVN